MKKSISFALAAVLALSAFAGVRSEPKSVAAETTSTETDANLEVLKAEVAKHTFLGAEPTKIYTGTLERMANENYPLDCTLDDVPTGHIGYRIDDFDLDGDSELLIIDQDKDHFAELVMYEVEGSQVVEKDRTKLVTDMDPEEKVYDYFKSGMRCFEGDSAFFTYVKEGKKYIAAEEFNAYSYFADGLRWGFSRTTYDGTKFAEITDLDRYIFGGSDLSDESRYYMAASLYDIGISVDPTKSIVNDKFRIRDNIPHRVVFATSKIIDKNITYDFETMKVGDKIDASTISFGMSNSVYSDYDDQADIGHASYKKLIPGKIKVIKVRTYKKDKGEVLVTWKESPAAHGYQVSVNGKKVIKNTYGDSLLVKVKKAKKYKVKVRAYTVLGGKRIYGKWGATKTVKAKK